MFLLSCLHRSICGARQKAQLFRGRSVHRDSTVFVSSEGSLASFHPVRYKVSVCPSSDAVIVPICRTSQKVISKQLTALLLWFEASGRAPSADFSRDAALHHGGATRPGVPTAAVEAA